MNNISEVVGNLATKLSEAMNEGLNSKELKQELDNVMIKVEEAQKQCTLLKEYLECNVNIEEFSIAIKPYLDSLI